MVALGAALAATSSQAAPVLERVVMLSRHGVRAPTATLEVLAAETGRPWPSFSVGPGELTPHGADALSAMGRYLRAVYAREGVLPRAGCPGPGAIQVWADGADHRTRQSGQLLAEALAPGCGVVAGHGPEGAPNPLFSASGSGVCPMDPLAALATVQARTQDGASLIDPHSGQAIATLKTLLGAQACTAVPGACLQGATTLQAGKGGPKIVGPLATAAGVAENLLLEYADDLAKDQVGWGGGSETIVAAGMPAHERSADLLRKTPYIAAHNGAVLVQTLLDLLQGRAPSDPHAPPLTPGARLVMIAGHDTNLSNVAGVLGLEWTLPGQPDGAAPDTTLAFELWRDPATGAETVRAVVYSQSLDQLRAASALDTTHPPGVTPVAIGACSTVGPTCAPDLLAANVRMRLPPECLH